MTSIHKLRIFKGMKGFQTIRPDWQALFDKAGRTHFFHSPQWYESYLAALEKNPDHFFIIAIYEQDHLRAIIPLKRQFIGIKGIGVTILSVPEHRHLTYRDILTDGLSPPLDLYQALCGNHRLARLMPWDLLRIKMVYKSSFAMESFAGVPALRSIKKKVNRCNIFFLEPFETMLGKLSKSTRKRLRNKRNRLNKLPGFHFQTAVSRQQFKEAYRIFLKIESSGWKKETGSAVALNQESDHFYRALYRAFSSQNACEINLMWIEGKPVVAELVLTAPGGAYTLKTGYDESFAHYSPGHFMIEYMMQRYYDHQAPPKQLNLMTGKSYMDYMRPQKEDVYDLYLFKHSLKGDLLTTIVRFRYLARKVYVTKIRPYIRTHSLTYKFIQKTRRKQK